MEEACLTPADLATSVMLSDKRLLAKARRKVSDRWVEGRAMTPAMVKTPRVRPVRRSRYGRWNAFPVDPRLYVQSRFGWYRLKEQLGTKRGAEVLEKGFGVRRTVGCKRGDEVLSQPNLGR
jgi:hypothetical protein